LLADRDLRSMTTIARAERWPPFVPAGLPCEVERSKFRGEGSRTNGLGSSGVKPIRPAVDLNLLPERA